MIIQHWLSGHTENGATVVARSNHGETLSVICNGKNFTGDTINSAVRDSLGLVNVTGLSPGKKYPYQLYSASTLIGAGTLQTKPKYGDSYSIGAFGCLNAEYNFLWEDFFKKKNINALINLGDWPYTEYPLTGQVKTYWGSDQSRTGHSYVSPRDTTTLKNHMRQCHRESRMMYGLRNLLRTTPLYNITDDHDLPGNDFTDLVQGVGQYGVNWHQIIASTAQDVQDIRAYSMEAMTDYWLGYPGNSDPKRDLSRTSDRQTYYRFTIGAVEFFCTSMWEYTDELAGKRIGDQQKEWLLDSLATSTAPLKVWFLSTGLAMWHDLNTERDIVFNAIQSGHTSWNQPGGLAIFGSDVHMPSVKIYSTAAGDSWDASILNVAPGGTGYNLYTSSSSTNRYVANKGSGTEKGAYKCAGLINVVGDEYLERQLVDETGTVRWRGRTYPGSNKLWYTKNGKEYSI